MSQLVFLNNDQVVTSSRNVARDFEKEHRNVIRDIERLLKNEQTRHMFYESYYTHEQNKQVYREFLMNRDGFTLLVMGFTGKQAIDFKLKYINAFNEMEQTIKQQLPQVSQAELIAMIAQQGVEQEKRLALVEQKQEDITKIISLNNRKDWRKETNELINKIAQNNGGTFKQTRRESYSRLETRARCDLDRRLANKIERLKDQGVPKRTINSLNYLDVIADDDRLIEIYIAIVKEMAIEHGIAVE